uniref:Uncharacterized protein n=2 Tax=Oryza TaxID=4527 RepID=Q69V40_ORYSJ|nr:hypothetical protein [Oryza sativa Japonica Group]BAD35638.1 hypothetical protein [Oryza sativa Japonica Group]
MPMRARTMYTYHGELAVQGCRPTEEPHGEQRDGTMYTSTSCVCKVSVAQLVKFLMAEPVHPESSPTLDTGSIPVNLQHSNEPSSIFPKHNTRNDENKRSIFPMPHNTRNDEKIGNGITFGLGSVDR